MTIAGQAAGRHRPQAAVIGAGVAGLTAAYLLQRAYDVTLYEAQDRLGGHAHTHDIAVGGGRVLALDPADALAYPARYLFEFLDHHGMLRLARSPGWRTVTGGSRCYAERIAKQLTTVAAGVPVRAIRRVTGGVAVHDEDGGTRHFAAAVVASHPDEALRLLDAPTVAEKEVLGAFRYTSSQVALHTDSALLPRAKAARASWNYLLRDCTATAAGVHVSYYLNRLQGLAEPTDNLVTLSAVDRVRPGQVLARMTHGHPVYDQQSVAAQQRLPGLSTPVVAYAGAYHGWGFHEDGCRSGIQAARALGVQW